MAQSTKLIAALALIAAAAGCTRQAQVDDAVVEDFVVVQPQAALTVEPTFTGKYK
ncbi:MAG: hypothetical protein ACU0CI_04195 [Shimia sp.]